MESSTTQKVLERPRFDKKFGDVPLEQYIFDGSKKTFTSDTEIPLDSEASIKSI